MALERLTRRESEALLRVTSGLSRKILAHEMGISFKTLDQHLMSAREKIGVHTTLGAVIEAARHGYIEIPGLKKEAR